MSRPSRTEACTASVPPGAAYWAWNTTARAGPGPASPAGTSRPSGPGVNQNSSTQALRRYLTSGPNGPAASAMAANTPCPASARSVARAGSQSGRRQTGVRGRRLRLSPVMTTPPASRPAPNQAGRNPPAPGCRTAAATPAASRTAPRAISRQDTGCALATADGRHSMQPHPPVSRLTLAYPSSTQNAAPSPAMTPPPTAAAAACPGSGDAPAHTATPVATSKTPAACSTRRQRGRDIRSARRMAVSPSKPRAARYTLLAPATMSSTPQLAANPPASCDAPWSITTTLSSRYPLRVRHHVEAIVRIREAARGHVQVHIGGQAAGTLLAELPQVALDGRGRDRRALVRVVGGRALERPARLRLAGPHDRGDVEAGGGANRRAVGVGRERVAVQAGVQGV